MGLIRAHEGPAKYVGNTHCPAKGQGHRKRGPAMRVTTQRGRRTDAETRPAHIAAWQGRCRMTCTHLLRNHQHEVGGAPREAESRGSAARASRWSGARSRPGRSVMGCPLRHVPHHEAPFRTVSDPFSDAVRTAWGTAPALPTRESGRGAQGRGPLSEGGPGHAYLRHCGLQRQRLGTHPRDVDVDLEMEEKRQDDNQPGGSRKRMLARCSPLSAR